MLFEKYDPATDRLLRDKANLDDLGDDVSRFLKIRFRSLRRSIRRLRCEIAACCAKAEAAAVQEYDSVMMLGTSDGAQELNDAGGIAVKWNTEYLVGTAFSHQPGFGVRSRGVAETGGLIRVTALMTFQSATPDTSIALTLKVNGATVLPGVGRHGVITAGASGHVKSSSSIEAYFVANDDDYVEVISTQNGAPGSVTPVIGESVFTMHRIPQPIEELT